MWDSLDFCFLKDRVKNAQGTDQKEQDTWHPNTYLSGAPKWLFPELTLFPSQRRVPSQPLEPSAARVTGLLLFSPPFWAWVTS